MTTRNLVTLLFVIWAAAFIYSVYYYFFVPMTGSGFTRGLDHLMITYSWQIGAAVIALGLWFLGRKLEPGTTLRKLTRLPAIMAALVALATIGLIALASFSYSAANKNIIMEPPGPVTEPR